MSALNLTGPIISSAKYNDLLADTLMLQLSDEEALAYTLISFYYKNAFELAKKNQLFAASYYICQGDALMKDITGELLILWLNLYMMPKKSFHVYKKGSLEDAEQMTLEVIGTCRALQSRGNNFIFFAEIQQYHNLSRIYFRRNEVEAGLTICNNCLKVLYENPVHSVNLIPGFKSNNFYELSIASIYQIFVETVYFIFKKADGNKVQLVSWLKFFLNNTLTKQIDSSDRFGKHFFIKEILNLLTYFTNEQWGLFCSKTTQYLETATEISLSLSETLQAYLSLF